MTIGILNINTSIPSTKAESVFLMKMAAAYSAIGYKVHLFVCRDDLLTELKVDNVFEFYGVQNAFRISSLYIPRNNLFRLIYLWLALPIILRYKGIKLLHSKNVTPAWACAKIFGMPVILELHDAPDKSPRMLSMFKQLIQSKNLSGIVVITHALKTYIQKYVPDNVKIVVTPDGVDDIFHSDNEYQINSAGRLMRQIADSKKIAVYTGHLYPGKGGELIVEIAAIEKEYHFIIIGGIERDIERLKDKSRDLTNVTFLGHKPPAEIKYYQRSADVLLLPLANKVEAAGGGGDIAKFTSPLKLFEYMASGRPIISSQLPVLKEILTDRLNAFIAPYEDPAQWVSVLKELKQSPELGNIISERALKDVAEFTWEKRAKKIVSAFFP